MIRTISALLIPALALVTTSCICKSGPDVPSLRPMPHFGGIPGATLAPADQPIETLLDTVRDQLLEEQGAPEPVAAKKVEEVKVTKEK